MSRKFQNPSSIAGLDLTTQEGRNAIQEAFDLVYANISRAVQSITDAQGEVLELFVQDPARRSVRFTGSGGIEFAELTSAPSTPDENVRVLWYQEGFANGVGGLWTKDDTGLQRILSVPVGAILMFAKSSAPNGYLECGGQAVSRTTYARLFAAIGITYGPGDGSTTFNLPDMRGRCPIGNGTGTGLTARTLGQQVGNETHQLALSEIPSHSHNVTDSGHTHGYKSLVNDSANFFVNTRAGGTGDVDTVENSRTTNNSTTGISIQTSGGSGSHNNMQPSHVVSYWIRY